MGRVFSSLKREVMNYNVENRAFKVISSNVPRPAPKFPSTLKTKQLAEDIGVSVEDLVKKNETLDSNLKNVYVVSHDPVCDVQTEKNRALPLNRITDLSGLDYGYIEPESVPEGKITLRKALELLSKRLEDKNIWTVDQLAQFYKLDPNAVEKILEHYKVFQMYIPEKDDSAVTKEWKFKINHAVASVKKIAVVTNDKKNDYDQTQRNTGDIKQPI